jgi:hypothetical protein
MPMRGRVIAAVILSLAVVLGLVVGVRGSRSAQPAAGAATPSPSPSTGSASPSGSPSGSPSTTDGSGVQTPSPQPTDGFPPIEALAAGETPPQFVVVSFDGACKHDLWQHYLRLGQRTGSHFTFFLSGLCLLPETKRFLYHGPHKPVGYSAVGFGEPSLIPNRVRDYAQAYDAGNEIGTHFLGHFCDPQGVDTWSSADWTSEITQARTFLDDWAEITGITDPSLTLPFDSSVWKGARTPCLAGKHSAMYPVWVRQRFHYDASSPGLLTWPRKVSHFPTLWNFPLQRIKVVGYGKTNLSMDYNLLFVQNKGEIKASTATCARIETSTYQSLMQALAAVEKGNHAPFFVGNHFNEWACGAYKNALTQFVEDAHAKYPGIDFVTFDYLTKWLDAQDPQVLARLQAEPPPHY